jgi:hypothetical protein
MTLKELASAIAKREGKKSQVKIGDIREILRIIADLMVEDPEVMVVLVRYANKRARASGLR